MVDEGRLVRLLDDGMRAGESGLDVALLELPAREQVAALVDEGRVRLERALGVGHDRKLFVLDLDELEGGERGVLALGGDNRDRLAVIADDPVCEDVHTRLEGAHLERLTGHVDPHRVLGHIVRRQDTRDAGNALRRLRVHAEELRVRELGPLQGRVEHAGERVVGRVARATRHLLDRVMANELAAEEFRGTLADGAHRRAARSR
jgi:hypothetical protein